MLTVNRSIKSIWFARQVRSLDLASSISHHSQPLLYTSILFLASYLLIFNLFHRPCFSLSVLHLQVWCSFDRRRRSYTMQHAQTGIHSEIIRCFRQSQLVGSGLHCKQQTGAPMLLQARNSCQAHNPIFRSRSKNRIIAIIQHRWSECKLVDLL